MSTQPRSPFKTVGKSLLSLLLAVQAVAWLLNDPRMNAWSGEGVDYSSFTSISEVRAAAARNIARVKQAALEVIGITPTPVAATAPFGDPAARTVAGQIAATSEVAQQSQRSDPIGEWIAANAIDQTKDRVNLVAVPAPAESTIGYQEIRVALADKRLDSDSLDEVRGGFEIEGTNLAYSFGIERAAYINGELVAHTVLNLKNLQWVAGTGVAPQLPTDAAGNAFHVIQNGAGNNFAAQVNPNFAGTVIQNTLNGQTIQNVTTINAVVNSAQISRSMAVQSAVQSGIINSLRN